VSLDEGLCWIDICAFERGLGTAMQIPAALSVYHGNFLDEPDARWAAQTRERLRNKFVRAVLDQARQLEVSGDWESAQRLYTNGLDADDLAESLYQGAMRCLLHQGKRAEALGMYRRMRLLLSVVLGIQPSKESEAVYQNILAT
jgi:LuxR family transcriptional regulator, maltose regulon positive regulatory protein